jgi:putative ABC transport system permease protein
MVAEVPSIVRCSPNSDGRTQIVRGNQNWFTQYRGVSPDYLLIKAWPVVQGTSFSDYDVANRNRVVILGQTVVRQLFGDEDPIGQPVRIGSIPATVVGVLQGRGNSTTGQDQDDTLFLPYTTVIHYMKGNTPYIDDIMCSASTNEAIPGARDAIADLLRARHRIADGAPDDFNMRTPEDSLRLQADTANTMEAFLSAVASVSLLVGGVGVMNIMLVSVTERTREIGLRMALGAREHDVRVQFLTEAATLGAVGGLFGVGFGLLGSNAIAQSYGWPMVVSSQTIAWSVAFSAAVGLVFGYYPARRAAALDPIEALRIE